MGQKNATMENNQFIDNIILFYLQLISLSATTVALSVLSVTLSSLLTVRMFLCVIEL